jgi:hypothetical protein
MTEAASVQVPPRSTSKSPLLFVGGCFSLAFGAFQLSAVFWPPDAIKYFGGPAQLSQARPVVYALLCMAISAGVSACGLYGLSGAGTLRRLPFLRSVVAATTAIYLLRGLLLISQLPIVVRHPSLVRFALFSVISLCVGLVHLLGVIELFKKGHPGDRP